MESKTSLTYSKPLFLNIHLSSVPCHLFSTRITPVMGISFIICQDSLFNLQRALGAMQNKSTHTPFSQYANRLETSISFQNSFQMMIFHFSKSCLASLISGHRCSMGDSCSQVNLTSDLWCPFLHLQASVDWAPLVTMATRRLTVPAPLP